MTDEKEKTTTARVLDWAAGQPFNNVLLIGILFFLVQGGYFAMNTAIPKHLEQIQRGYESLTESHRDERERTQQMYDRWINRANAERASESKIANKPPTGEGQ